MPKTPDYFAGKTIIITGAASGIGRAAALIFAREKANVVCVDIDEKGVEKTAETINAIGSPVLALTIDVTKRAAVEDMVELAIDGFGSVQFLFNSAGAATYDWSRYDSTVPMYSELANRPTVIWTFYNDSPSWLNGSTHSDVTFVPGAGSSSDSGFQTWVAAQVTAFTAWITRYSA